MSIKEENLIFDLDTLFDSAPEILMLKKFFNRLQFK